MKLEVGKVYKCNNRFVKIVHYESSVSRFIGLESNNKGEMSLMPKVHTYRIEGKASQGSLELLHDLEEIKPKETVTIGSNVYDKEEFEKAVAHLKTID